VTRAEFDALMAQHGIAFVDEAAWRLADLVARYEREACASIADGYADNVGGDDTGASIAADIRARGQA
jgi:hypothetical protein